MSRSRCRWLLSALLLAACAEPLERAEQSSAITRQAVLPVWFGGCDLALSSERCGIETPRNEPLRLTLWLEADAEPTIVLAPARLRGRRLEARAVEAGRQSLIELWPKDRVLELARGTKRFRLELVPVSVLSLSQQVQRVSSQAAAQALLPEVEAQVALLSGADKARGLDALARLQARAGAEAAADGLRLTAAELAEQQGQFGLAATLRFALVYAQLFRARDLAAAAAQLALADKLARDAKTRSRLAYYEGLLAQERSDYGPALQAFARAARDARRIGADGSAWNASKQRATLLGRLGAFDAALTEYAALVPGAEAATPCDRAAFLNSYGWLQLQAAEISKLDLQLSAAEAHFAQARERYEHGCASGPNELGNVIVNQALAALHAGRPRAAAAYLRELRERKLALPVYVALWHSEASARLDLAQGQARSALLRYRELTQLAETLFAPEHLLRSLQGEARALVALGQRSAAIRVLERAEQVLDGQLPRVPIGAGRGGFAQASEQAAMLLIELLLDAGRPAAAIAAARRARVRPLWDLAARARLRALPEPLQQRWQVAVANFDRERAELEQTLSSIWHLAGDQRLPLADAQRARAEAAAHALDAALAVLAETPSAPRTELAAPRPGEVLLGFFPLATGFFGFAQSERERVVARLPARPPFNTTLALAELPPEQLSAWLLEPFARVLDTAQRLRVLSYAELTALDLHALPWQGAPLLARLPVEYALDLPALPPTAAAPARALLVADPLGDLPAARVEAQLVAAVLTQRALSVERLFGFEATRARALAALANSDLFHYAGHGRPGEREGLDSELPLADAVGLSTGDVLTLSRVPAQVVLTACDTARVGPSGLELGLPEAFLLAGARQVVAATRGVKDATAKALAEALYAANTEDPAEALQRAALTLLPRAAEHDWSAFRVLVR